MNLRRLFLRKKRSEHDHFPKREEGVDLLEVHVAGVCVRRTETGWRVLVAKRQTSRSLYPGKWECGGGQVRRGEGFASALKRQFFEEFGLEVQVYDPMKVYEIHLAAGQKIIPGVRILCEASLGDVRLNNREFSEFRWLDLPVTAELDWIGGIKEVLDLVARDLDTLGIQRLLADLESTASLEVQEGIATCLHRYRSEDHDGAITAICGVVDRLTGKILQNEPVSNARIESYQSHVLDAMKSLEGRYRRCLGTLSSDEASQLWRNHRQAINQAAYVLGALRRHFSDAHGVKKADPALVLRAVECGVFIARTLEGLYRIPEEPIR